MYKRHPKYDFSSIPAMVKKLLYESGYKAGAENRWIPIRIEKPPAGQAVLVTIISAHGGMEVCQALFDRETQCWREAGSMGKRQFQGRAVLAWQPRPAPYRPGFNETQGWQAVLDNNWEEAKVKNSIKAKEIADVENRAKKAANMVRARDKKKYQ